MEEAGGFQLKLLLLVFLLLVGATPALSDQEQEGPWMPDGYRLLSAEERQSLPPEELKAIQTRNTMLLRDAVHAMTPEERMAVAKRLEAFGRGQERTQVEKQYVTMTTMMLLSVAMEEKVQEDRAADQARFQKLLRDQEETSRTVPPDQKSVEAEAHAIAALIGKEDQRRLYLRALGALRARPWNYFIRVCFHRIVRSDSVRSQPTSLYDAALVFVRARQAESPDEGSWFSLEAFLRLTVRGEVAQATKLFAAANAKGAKDVECRIFPLLLAEMDGNAAEAGRLRPRALEAWPKSEDLDRVLLESIDQFPSELAARARETFGKKYARAHPADWSSRVDRLRSALDDAYLQEVHGDAAAMPSALRAVESETTMLLSLPLSGLPEPHRAEVFALQLRAKAGLGKCEEVSPAITVLEAEAEVAYPRQFDPDSQPRARTVQDVQSLKASIGEERRGVEKLREALTDGTLEREPELRDVPQEERLKLAREALTEMEREVADADSLLRDKDDPAAAAEWTRHELADWEKAHRILSREYMDSYDLAGRGERLGIRVRAAEGQCLLARGMLLDAASILKPCVGGGRNFHTDCVSPLIEAGAALARKGDVREAAVIFNLVRPSSASSEALFQLIEAKAPGTVKKKDLVPISPMLLPKP
jgi:hypothetical protein